MAFVIPKTKLFEQQYDNLEVDTTNNPYMKYNKRASSNKALNTTKKTVVGAINELNSAQSGLQTTTIAALKKINEVVGDTSANATLRTDFQATGYNNTIDGIVKLKQAQDNTMQSVKDLVSGITKEVIFMYPKMIAGTVSLEQFVPFKAKVKKVIARLSNVDNYISSMSPINVVLQKGSSSSITFDNIQNIVIDTGESYKEYDLTTLPDPVEIDNEILKTSLIAYPNTAKNLCIVVVLQVEDDSTTPVAPSV